MPLVEVSDRPRWSREESSPAPSPRAGLFAVVIACGLILTCGLLPAGESSARRPPNIIFILADDLGWAEPGCYGNKFNETPNLDRMARQGIRFTEAYAAAPVCSPYRASFLTGQYPARHGILDYLRPNTETPLSTDHITLAEMLKQAGYFAERLEREAGKAPAKQVRLGFALAFGRPPSEEEQRAAEATIRTKGLFALCHVLLNANEFVYLD